MRQNPKSLLTLCLANSWLYSMFNSYPKCKCRPNREVFPNIKTDKHWTQDCIWLLVRLYCLRLDSLTLLYMKIKSELYQIYRMNTEFLHKIRLDLNSSGVLVHSVLYSIFKFSVLYLNPVFSRFYYCLENEFLVIYFK